MWDVQSSPIGRRDAAPAGRWLQACAALIASTPLAGAAAPLILEPVATIPIPDARFTAIEDVDIDGDWLIMGVGRADFPNPGDIVFTRAGYLYRRAQSGTWVLDRKLFEHQVTSPENNVAPLSVAMENGLAAMNMFGRDLVVFERSGTTWTQAPAQGRTVGDRLEIDAGTILGSDDTCGDGARAFRKNASGVYVSVHQYQGVFDYCDDERVASEADISGTIVVVPQTDVLDDPSFVPFTSVWEGIPPSAPARIPAVGAVSIEGDTVALGTTVDDVHGTHFYRRQGLGVWQHEQAIEMPDGLMTGRLPSGIQMDDGFVVTTRAGNMEVFRRNASGEFRYVAKLLGAGGGDVSGRRVVGVSEDGVEVFELPATLEQPERRQDDFEDRNAADWTPQAGSSFAVVASGGSYVYRQTSLLGNAISTLGNTDWPNQSVQADIKPTAFASGGSDRWFGLVARYTDANNYYYVTARRSNVIQLRKIVNGVFTQLASVAFPVALNRTYNLRLEAVGTLLRLYVDGRLTLEARDTSHSHGQAGVMMYMTRADYDNVIVSTQQFTKLLEDDFGTHNLGRWNEEGEGAWAITNEPQWVYAQTSLAGTARSVTGIATGDQIVYTRAKPVQFASGGERWFGVVARYVDASNYYYVTVRNTNTISLRKLVNGTIHVLDEAPLTVTLGATYRLRLEALGSSLRAYVNGRLVLEASDTTIPTGRYGLAAFKTSVEYDDFLAAQP